MKNYNALYLVIIFLYNLYLFRDRQSKFNMSASLGKPNTSKTTLHKIQTNTKEKRKIFPNQTLQFLGIYNYNIPT